MTSGRVTVVAKFLDLNYLFFTETAICIVERWKKYGLPFSALVKSCTGKSNKSIFFRFLISLPAGPRFVEVQKFMLP